MPFNEGTFNLRMITYAFEFDQFPDIENVQVVKSKYSLHISKS